MSSIHSFACIPTLSLLLFGLGGSPVLAEGHSPLVTERIQRILTVKGQGEEKIEATEAKINLSVEAQGKTADEVQGQVARRSDAVVKFLRSKNVRDLKTTSINLNPNYSYSNGKQRIIGYRASNSVQFSIAADQSGPIIDQAVLSGATRIGGISFKASDTAIEQAREAALVDATQNARSKAKVVLSELGFSEQEIVGIQLDDAISRPVPTARQFEVDAAAPISSSSPVIAGDQTIRASVTLQIKY